MYAAVICVSMCVEYQLHRWLQFWILAVCIRTHVPIHRNGSCQYPHLSYTFSYYPRALFMSVVGGGNCANGSPLLRHIFDTSTIAPGRPDMLPVVFCGRVSFFDGAIPELCSLSWRFEIVPARQKLISPLCHALVHPVHCGDQ